MFKGEYSHSIDNKGRLIIPVKFRDQLGDKFVITKGLDHCLFLYPIDEWNTFEAKLKGLPLSNPNARKFKRYFLAGADDVELDRQGRILINAKLREAAELTKEVVLAGVGERIEIWDAKRWEDSSTYDDMEEIAANMEELGI